jgi:predicted permease
MQLEFSLEMLKNLGIFALLIAAIHAIMLSGSYLVLRKKYVQSVYRIITIGTTFGNCAFFGIPIIEALMPEVASEVIVYTTVYAVVMNILGWTVGSAIISGDSKYISVKKIFLNPATIGLVVALLFYVLGVDLGTEVSSMIQVTGKSATPISMVVMGMRLATMDLKRVFADVRIYLAILVKQIVMPLITFGIIMLLPFVDLNLRMVLFITTACPAASIVLNFAEIVGEGQDSAANLVLVSTILSILTLPLVMLLLPLII